MNKIPVNIVLNIQSVLQCYHVNANILELIQNTDYKIEERFEIDIKSNNCTSDLAAFGINNQDKEIGDEAEIAIYNKLKLQYQEDNYIKRIERISETQPNYFPGYDIEIEFNDGRLCGVEVKGTRSNSNNIIRITNNELRSAIKNRDRFYLIIVAFEKHSYKISKIFCLCNPIELLDLNEESLMPILNEKVIGNIKLYEQQFILSIDKNVLDQYMLNTEELVLFS